MRERLIQDAKKIKIDISPFIKKEELPIQIKSEELDYLYEQYRKALERGSANLIAKARSNLISFKCRLGSRS